MRQVVAFYKATFSPCSAQMRQVDSLSAKAALEQAFHKWGMPLRIRLDNGPPFANTSDKTLPTALVIWLVSLGIEVIFSRPYSPQQNGSVECTQRISSRWAQPKVCQNPTQLQIRLDEVVKDHLEIYRDRHHQDLTRKQRFPQLFNNPRKYQAKKIDLQKVKQYLMQFKWKRKVYANGYISLFGSTFPIGMKYKHQPVLVYLSPTNLQGQVCTNNGQLIKSFQLINLSQKHIADLTIFSKNFTT